MSAKRWWPLWGLLTLTLGACAGSSPAPTATPMAIPVVTAAPSGVQSRAESFWLESREGTVIVELQPLNLDEPDTVSPEEWVFRLALTESGMDAPPLTQSYDLAQLAYLAGPNGEQVKPASWAVDEEGHMGHHVKGTLAFPGSAQSETIKVVIRDVGGVRERVFEWAVTREARGAGE